MKPTAHETAPSYRNPLVVSVCRQCGWVGPERTTLLDAREDGREHTREATK